MCNFVDSPPFSVLLYKCHYTWGVLNMEIAKLRRKQKVYSSSGRESTQNQDSKYLDRSWLEALTFHSYKQ